jgi:hypothetical protein
MKGLRHGLLSLRPLLVGPCCFFVVFVCVFLPLNVLFFWGGLWCFLFVPPFSLLGWAFLFKLSLIWIQQKQQIINQTKI